MGHIGVIVSHFSGDSWRGSRRARVLDRQNRGISRFSL